VNAQVGNADPKCLRITENGLFEYSEEALKADASSIYKFTPEIVVLNNAILKLYQA
jgi:hypothetical protein